MQYVLTKRARNQVPSFCLIKMQWRDDGTRMRSHPGRSRNTSVRVGCPSSLVVTGQKKTMFRRFVVWSVLWETWCRDRIVSLASGKGSDWTTQKSLQGLAVWRSPRSGWVGRPAPCDALLLTLLSIMHPPVAPTNMQFWIRRLEAKPGLIKSSSRSNRPMRRCCLAAPLQKRTDILHVAGVGRWGKGSRENYRPPNPEMCMDINLWAQNDVLTENEIEL
jgi:hypothetical protein